MSTIFLPSGAAIRDGRIVFSSLEMKMANPEWDNYSGEKVKNSRPLLVVRYEAGSTQSYEAAQRSRTELVALGYDVLITDDTIEVISPHGYPQLVYGTANSKVPTKEEMDAVLKAVREQASGGVVMAGQGSDRVVHFQDGGCSRPCGSTSSKDWSSAP